MSKITEQYFDGQPVFKQILNFVMKVNIQSHVWEHNSDNFYRAFKNKTHLITMLFDIF
jgi:hypothetical protein